MTGVNSATRMTGGEAVVRALVDHGVDTIFALPGIQNDWLFNALYDARDRIRVIHTRHEQGAAYLALGYALARGDVGVYNVVPGPGLLNTTAALATAYGLNARVFCLTGQIPSHAIGKGAGVLHEIPDQFGILRSLTKWAARVESPADAGRLVAEAFRQMRSGRPRPVGLEVPMDVLAQVAAVGPSVPPAVPDHPPVDLDMIERAATLLGRSVRPLIHVGSGAQGASAEIRALAEALGAPVVGYRTGRGVLDSRHPLSLTLIPAHELWKTADVVLGIGTHLRIPVQDWGTDDDLKVIRIDVDPTSHARIRRPDVAVTARAEDALPVLLDRLGEHNRTRPSRRDELAALRADWDRRVGDLEPQMSHLRVIREELGEHGIFVDELTAVGWTARIAMPVYHPRTFICSGQQGTLGYGFATALGVKVARPNVPVVSVTGDGGFMFNVQELATAVQHRIGLVTLVFNNNRFGNVQHMQKHVYGNRVIASDLHNPDFVRMAEAFGAQAFRANTPDELRDAMQRGFVTDLPTVIDIPIGEMISVDRFRGLPRVRPPQREGE